MSDKPISLADQAAAQREAVREGLDRLGPSDRKPLLIICIALDLCHDYLAERSDVKDGDYGMPAPNEAMSLLGQVDEAIEALEKMRGAR